ncbi:MAG: LysR family transcriptional regulator, partial [Nannocystaceae bacterium]|nr:LysR family transcriptional regulator [Nannocystaceae bacterium]
MSGGHTSVPKLAAVNLNHLLVFEAVYRLTSVSAAARELGMTQSGASNALAQLRLTFGDILFERVGNRMVSTEVAREIAPSIGAGVAQFEAALRPRDFLPERLVGTLTVAMPDYV